MATIERRHPGKQDVLDPFEQLGLDVLDHGQLPGVDDPHVEPGADRVGEEDRVHGFAQRVVAAEGEAQVGDTAIPARKFLVKTGEQNGRRFEHPGI